MAAGQADTDAVNVAQLKGVTTAMGGGSTIDSSGNVVAPTYTVNGNTYHDVADAITAAASGTVTFRRIGAGRFRRNGATISGEFEGSNVSQDCVIFVSFASLVFRVCVASGSR
jgi:type 1 fimbria pilin